MQFMETITLTNTNIYLSLPLVSIEYPFMAPQPVMSAAQRQRRADQWMESTSGLTQGGDLVSVVCPGEAAAAGTLTLVTRASLCHLTQLLSLLHPG